jgi:hypothetical protein
MKVLIVLCLLSAFAMGDTAPVADVAVAPAAVSAQVPVDFSSYLSSQLPPWAVLDASRDMSGRPVYPYSLVPGGVHDPKELEQVLEDDPVLSSYYRGFDFRHARVVQLTQDREVYVSYRIGGHVYWTTRRLTLRRGEKIITDGSMILRTRCGNQVSEHPRTPTSTGEPSVDVLETSVIAPHSPRLPSLIVNNGGTLTIYPPPLHPPSLPGCDLKKEKDKAGKKKKDCEPHPPSTVPEPSTFVFLVSGLIAVGLRWQVSQHTHKWQNKKC